MTALSIVQKAAARVGLPSPSAVFGSNDEQVVRLRNIMNQAGEELMREHAWTRLITEKTFTTVATAAQTNSVPDDLGWYINETMWNRTTVQQVGGPMSPAEWQRQQASPVLALPNGAFRFRGASIYLSPTPTAGQTVAYEYVSNKWAQTNGSVAIAVMTADTDSGLLDESLITLGTIWRYKAALGLDYGEHFRTYEIQKELAIGRDGGRKSYQLGGGTDPIWRANIPEGNWGQ